MKKYNIYKPLRLQFMRECKKREKIQSNLSKIVADVDYIAMLNNIELELQDDIIIVDDQVKEE